MAELAELDLGGITYQVVQKVRPIDAAPTHGGLARELAKRGSDAFVLEAPDGARFLVAPDKEGALDPANLVEVA